MTFETNFNYLILKSFDWILGFWHHAGSFTQRSNGICTSRNQPLSILQFNVSYGFLTIRNGEIEAPAGRELVVLYLPESCTDPRQTSLLLTYFYYAFTFPKPLVNPYTQQSLLPEFQTVLTYPGTWHIHVTRLSRETTRPCPGSDAQVWLMLPELCPASFAGQRRRNLTHMYISSANIFIQTIWVRWSL